MADAVSLFFPMFNEEGNISQAVESALKAFASLSIDGEVIVVDDGSRDNTGAVADRLAGADRRVRVVHHQVNRGYGAAVRSGLEAARCPLIILADGDNQFDLLEIRFLIDAITDRDMVSGYRISRRDPFNRRAYAFMYNRLARTLFDIPIKDVNCGLKIYRRELTARLLPHLRSTGALINVEMLARARKLGARVGEVGVHHYPRTIGSQTGGNPAVILRAFRELFALSRELRMQRVSRAGL